ncbi:MAG: glycosyltransferase family 2 protein [Rhodothermales bacterium]|nr:glycosyltransferase family 2 protein [Rhodothermales bacterium]
MPARVSIIIVTWNGLELLKRCLPSVVATDYPNLEIIISDNNSSDGSSEWVTESFPDIKVLRHPQNYAFCRGNNEGIKVATGDIVVLLNNDVEVPPDWLNPIVESFEADLSIGAIQPKLLQMENRDHFEYSGGAGGHLDRFGYPFTRGRVFFTMEMDNGQYDETQDIFWASGAALALRRTAIDTVGLLDENFVLHMEEIDLCWRLQRAGYRIQCNTASVVYHIGGASLPPSDPQKAYYNFRNSLMLLYKNLPTAAWPQVFVARLLLDSLACVRALVVFRPREAWAIIRAYADGHRMKSLYQDERPRDGDQEVLPDYRRSIVIDYFLRRRRLFSDLPSEAFTIFEP